MTEKAAWDGNKFSGQGQVTRRRKVLPRKERNLGEGKGYFLETWEEIPAETWVLAVHGSLPCEFFQDRYPI